MMDKMIYPSDIQIVTNLKQTKMRNKKQYDRTHPEIWGLFITRALMLAKGGQTRLSSKAIFEFIRYEHKIALHNDMTPYYSRKATLQHKELRGLFIQKSIKHATIKL